MSAQRSERLRYIHFVLLIFIYLFCFIVSLLLYMGFSLVVNRATLCCDVCGLLFAVASLVAELRLYGTGFGNCGSQV